MSSDISSTKKSRAFGIVTLLLSGALVVYIAYPIANIITIVEPRTFMESITRPQIGSAFLLSQGQQPFLLFFLESFGIPFAYCMARYNFPGKFLIKVLIIIPLVIPPLASGTLLLVYSVHTLL